MCLAVAPRGKEGAILVNGEERKTGLGTLWARDKRGFHRIHATERPQKKTVFKGVDAARETNRGGAKED